MASEVLVYTLPVDRRPSMDMYYGHLGEDARPICKILTTGEVCMLDGARSIQDVMLVLGAPPFGLTFEELRGVRIP